MDQLTMLWEYQQEDMKAERLANEIKRSPLRQKLEQDRNLYMEKQKQHKQIEEQVAVMADRKDAIRDAIVRCEEQLKGLLARFEAAPPADLEGVRALMAEVARCKETIASYENEMKRMVKESGDHEQRQRNIRHDAAKLRAEFEQLKAQYEQESPAKKAALDAQRAVAKQKAEGIDAQLMEHYNIIRKHITPPMARLIGDQCGGCNTSQPSALLRKIKSGSEIVECETCGRMIIQ